MSLKMTPSDIALAALVVSLKTYVHQVTVAVVQAMFGQHYYT